MVSFKSRVIAICAAGTLAIGSAAVAAPISFAQETADTAVGGEVTGDAGAEGAVNLPFGAPAAAGSPNGLPTAAQADLIDANNTGTLKIKKILGDPQLNGGATHHGAPSEDSKFLQGATFNIKRLDIDLTVQQGWRTLNDLVANPEKIEETPDHSTQPAEEKRSQTTNTEGEATFDEIPMGVYVVTEESREGYSTSAPFLVSLPYSDGNSGKWEYTRTVYPKNQEFRPNKQVDAQGATLGSNMAYTINAPVPAGTLSNLKITDNLIENLQLVADSPAPKVSFSEGNGAGTPLTAGADYNLTATDQLLEIEFTESGLGKLEQARIGKPNLQVHVQFEAKVVSLPAAGQSITNTAEIEYPNGAKVTTDSPAADGEADPKPTRTDYANLTITKFTNDTEGDVDLSGAEFELYRCVDKELKGEAIPVSTTETLTEGFNPVEATTLTTVKSQQNEREGEFRGYGIPVRTYAAGGTATQDYEYCVVETKAPDGFIRNPEVHKLNLQTATANQAAELSVRVENQRDNFLSSLPATGAWGIILVFLVGLGLLARGFYTSRKDGRATA
ncbi:SpaH/EbpB family LPXTG-anchored major pilin [Corynebacterium pseudodiphtheriticum]|uniref:SpaH/EbpB family LPXTG-anchored major pilin n=1 Tax=Corynebacterium pseudodiphtheriticum TaxID=37637 RepID=UPI00234D2349|nr:SpaH/EbpB family LPXTG-anchored major pilin [Corynebacterium pseudodiphtheriticum]MDC7109783.1 SpaH/EbpB family LPXTG-anchored major pilin [Corynebacterium pseudodiphtheriticum]MDC7114202.1 SpaH/EbpB family LPXTG-anchored major pilin [Corynebacterium pseudodiphtheriticum]